MVSHKHAAGKRCITVIGLQCSLHVPQHCRTFLWAARMDECLPNFPQEQYFEMTSPLTLRIGALEVNALL